MLRAVYNSGIPYSILKSLGLCFALPVRACRFGIIMTLITASAFAADWSVPEGQLAKKIAAVTGPGTVALTFENRSSLGRRDTDVVENGLRAALEQAGIHFVKPEQAVASVMISLSENVSAYVWVAQIHQGAAEASVVMVSVPRSGRSAAARDSMPVSLHKTLLWGQSDPILDVAILEENGTPTRIAVLSADNITYYRWQGNKWQSELALPIRHVNAWPLDLRGRLVLNKDHNLDAYLPGMICQSGGTTLTCRESDDPWPIVPLAMVGSATLFPTPGAPSNVSGTVYPLASFFASTRNFFTGVLTPPIGKFTSVPKFYTAAFVPRDRYMLWMFSTTDGRVHMVDGMSDQVSKLDWGSDIATVRTSCGAGWQVLVSSAGEQSGDSVRAYEFPDRDPVAVSTPVDVPGPISTLWTESKGDTAIAVVKDRETGSYEALRVSLVCSQ